MKKITTILMLLMLTCMGAKAQVISKWSSDLVPVTKDAVVASAGSGARYAFRMPSKTKPGWCDFVNEAGALNDLSDAYLFTIEPGYKLKRISDGQFLSGNAQFNGTGIALTLTNRIPKEGTNPVSDYDTGYSEATPFVSFDNASGAHYNCGNGAGGLQFRGGTGGWSVYVAYGPIWKNVTINYMCGDEPVQDSKNGYAIGGTVEAPAITGYEIVGATSETINADDQVITFTYQKAAMNYSVVLKDMPDGTNVTIGGTTVANGDTYQTIGAVSESDVAVTYPAGMGYDNETFSVVIEGTTVTIIRGKLISIGAATGKFYNGTTEKPITSSNQFLNKWVSTTTAPSLTLSCQAGNMIINNTYPTETKFNLHTDPRNYTLSTDDGYIVRSYSISAYVTNQGTINGTAVSTDANNPTTVNVEGDGATSLVIANTANPWMYITNFTVLVQAIPSVPVTYIIQEGGQTIYTSDPVLTALGTVTELPDNLKRSAWYDYEAFSVNVTAETTTITVAATAKENQPVKYTEDTTSPYYYNMNIRSQYLVFDETNEDKVKLQATSEPFNPNASWAFIGNPYDGFRVINQTHGASNVLTYTTVSMSRPTTHNIQFQTGAEAEAKTWLIDTNNTGIVLRMKENQNIYFHHENGNDKYLRTCSNSEWSAVHNDAGSTIILTTDKEVLVQLYNVLNEKKDFVGEGLNKYSVSGMTADEFLTLLNNVKSDLDNDNTGNFLNDYNALNAVTFSINQPEANTFLRIKSAHDTYLSGVASTVEAGRLSLTTTTDASTIFFFDGNKLLTYGNGLYANGRAVADLGGEGLNYQFEASTVAVAKYAIRFNPDGGTNRFLYAHGTDKNYADQQGSDAANCAFTLEEVTELPITLRSTDNVNYFATFSAPVNVRISDASLNTVTNNNKTAAYNTVDTDMLKAGVGVLLSGTSATATATIITDEVPDADYGLVKYYAATAGTGDESMLYLGKGKTSGKAGFYKLGEGTSSNGFKAYLSTAAGAKEGFELEFAGVTGIDNMENGTLNMENGAVYNLQGQRVNKAQKGVFIQNGKKVVLK